MTSDTEAPRPWVPVLDMTFVFAFAGTDGKPARITHTIREHLGDVVQQLPGGFSIKRESQDETRDGESYRIPGDQITINAALVVAIERTVRLERRERLTVKQMMELPGVKETEERLRQHNREMRER